MCNEASVPINPGGDGGWRGQHGPAARRRQAGQPGARAGVSQVRWLLVILFSLPTNIFCPSNRMPVNQTDPAGNTPLHWAARAGQLDCVAELVAVNQIGLNKVTQKIFRLYC